jgi:hydrogenase large subunit
MSRTIVGPFNRVEGDLEVALDIDDGRIRSAEVTTTLYRGYEQLLDGRVPLDALVIAPRVCGICSVSQSIAAAAALRELAGGRAADNGALATNIAHAAENVADHLTHFYLFFMPDFARAEYAGRRGFEATAKRFKAVTGEAARDVLPARRRLLEIMGVLAGKWPHSLAFQPGGTTRAVGMGERVQLLSLVAEFQTFLESALFGVALDRVLALESLAELDAFADGPGRASDFAAFLRLAADLRLDEVGRGPGPLMSFGAYHGADGPLFARGLRQGDEVASIDAAAIGEDVAYSWMREGAAHPFEAETVPVAQKPGAYSWAKAPRYRGQAVEVGAFARQAVDGHPLIVDLLRRDGGSSVRGRVVARLIEIAALTHALGGWLRALRLKDAFCRQLEIPPDGRASGLVEAARGALGHWLVARAGKIARYQIIAPTTWNFSPRDREGRPGPLEGALAGLEVGALGARAPVIQHVVRSFDPCMVCTAH